MAPEPPTALADLLLTRLPVKPEPTFSLVALEEALATACAQGRAAWPALNISPETYVAYLAPRVGSDCQDLIGEVGKLRHADLYLACSCVAGQEDALCAFDRDLLVHVPLFLSQLRLTEAQVQEVQHALRERMLFGTGDGVPRIVEYQGRGTLKSWLRVAAVRAGLSLKRDRDEQLHEGRHGTQLARAVAKASDADPELQHLRQRYQAEYQAAVLAAFATLSAEQRGVMQMYYVDGLNTRQIAKIYEVNATTASRWVVHAREQLAEEARRQLRDRLRINDAELLSIYRALQSQFDLSIRQALIPTPG